MIMMGPAQFEAYLERARPNNPVASVTSPAFLRGVSDSRKGLGFAGAYEEWLYVEQAHYEIGRQFGLLFPASVDIVANANLAASVLAEYVRRRWINV